MPCIRGCTRRDDVIDSHIRPSPYQRILHIVDDVMRGMGPDDVWQRLHEETMRLDEHGLSRLHKALCEIACGFCESIPEWSDRDTKWFYTKLIDNGRWMEFIDAARSGTPVLQTPQRFVDPQVALSGHRLEQNRRNASMYRKHQEALKKKLPHVRWHDVTSTPASVWNTVHLSSLSEEEAQGFSHATRNVGSLRERHRLELRKSFDASLDQCPLPTSFSWESS